MSGLSSAASALLAGLDPEQTTAVSAPPAPLVVIAGAGSGKTTVLTRRLAYQVLRGDAAAKNILAVSHTTKAAAEVQDRLLRIDPSLSPASCLTVHAAAWKVLRQFHARAGFEAVPELISSTLPLLRDAARQAGVPVLSTPELIDLASEVEWASAWGYTPDTYVEALTTTRRTPPLAPKKVLEVLTSYASLKQARNVVDFADLLSSAATLIETDAEVASRVRSVWSLVVVDEFQDTDRAQARFLKAVRGPSNLWMVVGDPRQTIYSFKGADPSLLRAEMKTPGSTVVHLSNSWRCSQEILSWANASIGSSYGPPLKSASSGPSPRLLDVYDESAELDAVVAQLRTWRNAGVPYQNQAVLFRFNAASAKLEAALTAADIPFQVLGGPRFMDRPEVRAVLQVFGRAARLDPEEDGLELLRSSALESGFDLSAPPDSQGAVRTRWESVRALLDLAQGSDDFSAGSLLDMFLSLARTDASLGVSLGTVHSAKGLEWDAVLVFSLVEGSLPSSYAGDNPVLVEEERRLFYVAITRARRHLSLSLSRRFRNIPQQPSRFLNNLPGLSVRPTERRSSKSSKSKGFSNSPTRSGSRTTTNRPPASSTPALPEAPRCQKCSKRLTGDAARTAGRCSPGCLDGVLLERYRRIESWCTTLPASTPTPSDKTLFRLAVLSDPGPAWPAGLPLPQL